MSGEFAGRIALVTGGGKGVGRAVCQVLADRGAHVIVNCFHSEAAARSTVAEICERGGSAEMIRASVADKAAVAEMFSTIAACHGGLDVLVNNASRGLGSIADLQDEDWAKTVAVNLDGNRWCSQHAARLMAGRGGTIVNLSATGSSWVIPDYAAGGVIKAAVESLTRYLAVEFAPRGVRVNAASASVIDNETLRKFSDSEALRETITRATPLGRLADETELAEAVAYLASDRSSFTTGQTLVVDGGLTLASASFSPSGEVKPAELPRPSQAVEQPADAPLVAIVGTGMVVPGANGPQEFWNVLGHAPDAFTEPDDRWSLEHFWSPDRSAPERTYSRVAGFVHDFVPHPSLRDEENQRDVIKDETARWLRHTLLQARDGVTARPGDRCGLYVGTWPGGSQALAERVVVDTLTNRAPLPEEKTRTLRTLLLEHYPRAQEQHVLPDRMIRRAAEGVLEHVTEAVVVDTACSSSLYTADFGAKALLAGECDIAYCGGVEVLDPTACVLFAKLRGLSPTGRVHSLDNRANGTLFSDGASMVALKLLSRAQADGDEILGVLSGFGGAADGRGKSISAPNPKGQSRAIGRARAVNNIEPEALSWVLAHATGTPAGDSSELEALNAFAPEGGYLCTSNKSDIGHTGWAAGAASIIHCVQALKHQRIPAQSDFTTPPQDAVIPRITIPDADHAFPRSNTRNRTVGISAFGFGGTNGHLLVTDRPASDHRSAPSAQEEETVLVAWSAHLPGTLTHDGTRSWLRGEAPAPACSFGETYPRPAPAEVRLTPKAIQAIDRCQLMAIEVTNRFLSEHGELWSDVHDTTGVFAAHSGMPHRLAEATLRCHTDRLTALLADTDPATAAGAQDVLDQLRDRVPETNEDTQPGVMTNVIPSRIASRFDLHGATMTLDAGPDSTTAALKAAERYLHTGELDLALVLALNGNSTTELATLTGTPPGELAEGAFLLAVTTARQAEQHNWPVISRLDLTAPAAPNEATPAPAPERGRNYLGAQGALEVLKVTERAAGAVELHPAQHPASSIRVTPAASAKEDPPGRTSRYEQRLMPAPAPPVKSAETSGPIPTGIVLTDANAHVQHLSCRETTVLTTDPDRVPDGALVVADLDDDEAVQHALQALDQADPAVTVISSGAAANRPWPTEPAPALRRLHELLLLAVQRLWPRWTAESSLAVVLLGQREGLRPHPHAALFTGFVKSLAREHLHSQIFAVLTDITSFDAAADLLTAERSTPRTSPVVWHLQGARHLETLAPAPLPAATAAPPVTDESVVLVTGGAGGLPAAILKDLSRRTRPHVWLLGRSDITELTAYQSLLDDPHQPLERREVIHTLQQESNLPLRSVIAKSDRLLRAHQVQALCDELRQHFGHERIHYVTCDLKDQEDVENTVADVLAETGRIDVVVHGAGVFKPALVETMTLADFRAVRDTKLLGYHHLKQALAHQPPTRWYNLGSAGGTYGLAGETAYASANDFLAAASRTTAAQGAHELTIALPLWAESGFGAAPANRDYLERQGGLTPVTDEEGTRIVRTELASAAPGSVGTYLGARELGALAVTRPGYVRKPDDRGYLLSSTPAVTDETRTSRWQLRFDAERDSYLHHHLVDGKPTVPGTLMLEIAAEAAQRLFPDLVPHGFRQAHFEAFIKPFASRRALDLNVTAGVEPTAEHDEGTTTVAVSIESDVTAPDGRVVRTGRRHFHTNVLLSRPARHTGTTMTRAPTPATARPVRDPYYAADSPVWLQGIFCNTTGSHAGDAGDAWSTWAPGFDAPETLTAMRSPFLMLCAASRTAALTPTADGQHPVFVPRVMDHIDLHVPGANDVELTQRYGENIHLSTAADGEFRACAPDGTLLLTLSGVSMTAMGSITPDPAR